MATATVEPHQNINNDKVTLHPWMLMLALGIAGMIMLFGGLTSAYIVKAGSPGWIHIQLPGMFNFTTAIIILSSFTLHWSLQQFKLTKYNAYKIGMLVTFILGATFLIGQYYGWVQLRDRGLYVDGTASASFLYVISGIHAAHILGGVIALFFLLLNALRFKYNPENLIRIRVATIYWHFVDILWIYLFIFFQLTI